MKKGDFIACGGTASVFQGLDQDGTVLKFPERREDLLREATILQALNIPRVVELVQIDQKSRCLVLKRAPGIQLDKILQDEVKLEEREAALIVKQIAEVLSAMHSHEDSGYVHYDLSLSNVFWDRAEQDVTVIDFGTSYKLSNIPEDYRTTLVGTPIYFSPEKLHKQPELGKASDIYALGIMWYELVVGWPPFNPSIGRLEDQILKDVPFFPNRVSQTIQTMILQMLSKDPELRPCAESVVAFIDGDRENIFAA